MFVFFLCCHWLPSSGARASTLFGWCSEWILLNGSFFYECIRYGGRISGLELSQQNRCEIRNFTRTCCGLWLILLPQELLWCDTYVWSQRRHCEICYGDERSTGKRLSLLFLHQMTHELVPRETCVHPFLSQAFQVRKLALDSMSRPIPENLQIHAWGGLSGPCSRIVCTIRWSLLYRSWRWVPAQLELSGVHGVMWAFGMCCGSSKFHSTRFHSILSFIGQGSNLPLLHHAFF